MKLITEKNPYVLLCAYGSLRLNQTNWRRFLENKSKYLGTIITEPNYEMYNLGLFPIICPGKTSIVCDVIKISSQRILESILKLESCSNENELNYIDTEFGRAIIFVQKDYKPTQNNLIKSGNWNIKPLIRKNYEIFR